MENKKEILWSILIKYDGIKELKPFCDSLSMFIQSKQNGEDIINIFQGLSIIDNIDKKDIDDTIGIEINNFLFFI